MKCQHQSIYACLPACLPAYLLSRQDLKVRSDDQHMHFELKAVCELPGGTTKHVDGSPLTAAHLGKLKDGAGSTLNEWPVAGNW